MGIQGWLTQQACACRSAQHGGWSSPGGHRKVTVKAQGWSGMGSGHLPLLSLSGATSTSNEEREHPDQKTEAKEPCQDQGLLRCEWRGGTHSESHSNPAPNGCPSACLGRGGDVSWPNCGTEVGEAKPCLTLYLSVLCDFKKSPLDKDRRTGHMAGNTA